MPSLVLVAGDPSGDAHAAQLVTALKARNPALTFAGLGGPAMRQAGVSLLDDLTATAAIGPFDAARHLGKLLRARRLLERHLQTNRPDLTILVDFGDYNLPLIAPLVKRYGVPIAYYISPQVWAWGRWRLRYIRRYVDRMIVFFPFEEAFYRQAGVAVTWVGHPLLDHAQPTLAREEAMRRLGLNPWRMTVGLLPGSRADEVRRHLPLLLRAARQITWDMPGVQFVLPKAPAVSAARLEPLLARSGIHPTLADGRIADALPAIDVAIVVSGTATLDAALAGVPMAVVYRTSWPTYLVARSVVRIPRIAMVNVVAERELVPELIQHRATPPRIARTVVELLRSEERRQTVKEGLREVTARLGQPGAVDRAAGVVLEMLR